MLFLRATEADLHQPKRQSAQTIWSSQTTNLQIKRILLLLLMITAISFHDLLLLRFEINKRNTFFKTVKHSDTPKPAVGAGFEGFIDAECCG